MGDPLHCVSTGVAEELQPGRWIVTESCSCGWSMTSEGNCEEVARRNAIGYADHHCGSGGRHLRGGRRRPWRLVG